MSKTAILVDGAFYRKAVNIPDWATAKQAAQWLYKYCMRHINELNELNEKFHDERCSLYRIYYYDCLPLVRPPENRLSKGTVDVTNGRFAQWNLDFFEALKTKRKVAMRMGELAEHQNRYLLMESSLEMLVSGEMRFEDLTGNDFLPEVRQKGVDTRICIDIVTLACKRLVDQIILIAGDSDFVPAAKLARREGIDFILDPLRCKISPLLREHIDGLRSAFGHKHSATGGDEDEESSQDTPPWAKGPAGEEPPG